MSFWGHIRNMDFVLIIASVVLSALGLIAIYSTSVRGGDFSDLYKQIGFLVISIISMIAISFIDNRILRENSYLLMALYILCVIGLIGIFFFAPEIRGIKAWYKIGDFSFDPVEPTKIVLILLLAKYFSKRHVELYKVSNILLSGFYALIPAILVFFRPEFGAVLVIGGIWIGILLVSGIKIRDFIALCLVFVLILSLCWLFLFKDYQKNRILSFVTPQSNQLGVNWSQTQSRISIGSGGIFGAGIGQGSQTQYGFLSEPRTDFIFSVIGEEMGLFGVLLLLGSFTLLLWRILKISLNARSNFSRLFAMGFAIAIFTQMVINVGMNTTLLPVIGVPLPLVSYGGGNLIFSFIALGILQNIKITKS